MLTLSLGLHKLNDCKASLAAYLASRALRDGSEMMVSAMDEESCIWILAVLAVLELESMPVAGRPLSQWSRQKTSRALEISELSQPTKSLNQFEIPLR